jgi:acetylornithine deacetylase/succinyl-diaminopimelate desuccinylase-like protein
MKVNEAQQKVLGLIDRKELIELALTLGNIPSAAGEEAEIGNFIYDWLARNEYSPRRIGFVLERSCMAGVLAGTGGGISLAFNSHMDTAKQVDDFVRQLPESGGKAAWVEGKYLMGAGIVNDKGPMAAWMIAANAIRKAGVQLRGELVLTMVPGEIDQEPVDEFTSARYLSKEVGARYMITRGIVADCALVAEGTHFKVAWAGAGKACFKITVLGSRALYVPFLPPRGEPTQSPNAIVKTAVVIAGLEDWARDYERNGVVDTPGGQFVPKANIGAVRAGNPAHISSSSEACHLYVDVRLAPGADPLAIRADLRDVLAKCGVEGKVELYTFRKAQVADDRIAPLVEAIGETHVALGYERPALADAVYSSMWRDHIAFIEAGIPALTYGPGAATAAGTKLGLLLDDLERAARSYALIALDMCMREKKAPGKAAARDR